MKTNHKIQLPLIQDEPHELIELILYDITPVDLLDSQEPDEALIQSIAESWVPPIIVCPENRIEGDDHRQLYYPVDGKRRMKAVAYLASIGYKMHGVPVEHVPFQAVLYKDILPEQVAAYRVAFQANHLRSDNPLTDVSAVKTAAQNLGVDVFTKEGRSAIAAKLRTSPQTVKKVSWGLLVSDIVFDAYKNGKISHDTLKAIIDIKDADAKVKITQRIIKGESLTKADVSAYNKAAKQAALAKSSADHNIDEFSLNGNNPLAEAISLLEHYIADDGLNDHGLEDLQRVLELLKTLI